MKLLLLSFFVFGFLIQVQAQTRITGTIISDDGETLPGASVLERGTTNGTVSDVDGKFDLSVHEDATLVISFVGYQSQEIPLNGRSSFNIIMLPDVTALEEVVVIGYGKQERKEITSAISSVKGKDFEDLPKSSVDVLLQGRAAGVQVTQNSGAPGGGMTVRIRGNTSIGGGNEPLYVVDGVPIRSESNDNLGIGNDRLNPIADINPSDIASVEILKDAAATSIYGARASNGVVLITTKTGNRGAPQVSFTSYVGFQSLPKKLSVLNARQYREIKGEAFVNEGHPNFSTTLWEDITDSVGNPFYTGDTDWQSHVFQKAMTHNYELAVRGGSENMRYSLSGGYITQEGIIIESGYERLNLRSKTDYTATDKLNFGSNLSYSRIKNDRVSTGGGNNSVLGNMFNTPPTYQAYFPDDWPNIPNQGLVLGAETPLGIATQSVQDAISNRLIGSFYGEYEIIPDLIFKSSIGIDLMVLKEDRFLKGTINPNRPANTRVFEELSWINENTLAYNKTIDNHNFNFLVGYSQQEIKSESVAAGTSGAPTDKIITLNAGSVLENATSFTTSWGIASLFGRINYNYKDRYLVGLTVRRDGSSRFGSNSRYGTFPSLSLGWRVIEEPFIRTNGLISDLKIRASYGRTGNQDISNFIAQGILQPGENYNGIAGIAPASNGLPNSDLTWETTDQLDVGLDFSILDDRVTVIADYYVKNTNDLLFNIQIPETSGFTNLTTNLGEIQNKGVEFQLLTTNFEGEFKWTTGFNISSNKNKVIALPDGEDILESRNGFTGIIREGLPLGTFYGYKFLGVYASDSDVPEGLKQNGFDVKGGFAKFDDLDGNNVIDPNDRQIIGSSLPDFTGGLSNTFTYKGFDLSFLFTFSEGGQIMNGVAQYRDGMSGFFVSPSTKVLDRWQEQGDITNTPIIMRTDPPGNYRSSSDYWLEDGSYVRLQYATLSYSFNNALINRIGMNLLKVYVTGQNLLTFTDYSGYDPETITSVSASTGVFGVDDFLYPLPRTIILGVKIDL